MSEAIMFEVQDWQEFCGLATLPQKAGVPSDDIPRLVAKELADNALDASGACRVGFLEGSNGFFVEDDGAGLPGDDEAIGRLFSVGRPMTSSKRLRLPTRGALGNGLRVVSGAVLATGGSLRVATAGRILDLIPQDGTGETTVVRVGACPTPGTRVEVRLGPALKVDATALDWALEAVNLAEGGSYFRRNKTSAHWYDSDAFFQLLQAAKGRTVRDLISAFDGCSEPKAGKIAKGFAGRLAGDLSRDEADILLTSAREAARPIKASALGAIGARADLGTGYAKAECSLDVAPARGDVGAAVPIFVEAWVEIGSRGDDPEFHISVNRTPVATWIHAYHEGVKTTVFGCNLDYGIKTGRKPIHAHVNVTAPFLPLTSDGKTPDLDGIADTITKAVQTAARRARNRAPATAEGRVSQRGAILECLDAAIDMASGNRSHRYSERNLYYPARDLIKVRSPGVPEPTWNYFKKVITEHEERIGHDLPGITRDNRGILYHPHTREEIQLGTLAVEEYRHRNPVWLFNKVLYCEKEGFFQTMKDLRWPERNDCALLTSKGYASRAARDVIDLLGEKVKGLRFYCIHDADAYGTMIYQSLCSATKARGARTVDIVNLGLEPEEAIAMGLRVEPVERKQKGKVPIAGYVAPQWRKWLQTNRIELNAMTAPEFIAWLDRKFAAQVGKLVPPSGVMVEQLEEDTLAALEERIREDILREAGFEARVAAALDDRRPVIRARVAMIRVVVERHLRERPEESWRSPVRLLAETIATDGTETPAY